MIIPLLVTLGLMKLASWTMLPIRWAVMFVAQGRGLHAQASEILGTWRGTSTCVKEAWNSACNDEQVIYYVTTVPGRTDSVALDARKVVDGKPEPMARSRWDTTRRRRLGCRLSSALPPPRSFE